MTKPKNPFQLISSEIKYQNPWMSVREDKIISPSGKDGMYGVVTFSDGVAVLLMDDDGNVYLANEYKYALQAWSPHVFGGMIDDGETPLDAARRELEEESGWRARQFIPLGFIDPLTTAVKEREHCFLARGIESGQQALEDFEAIEVEKVPFQTAVDWAMTGRISDATSVATILRAKIYLDKKETK